jgi:hypothetical protein
MLDVNQQPGDRSPQTPTTLAQWLYQCLKVPPARLKTRLRGNTLHILIETPDCLAADQVLPILQQAMSGELGDTIAAFLPATAPPIYRVAVYSRSNTQPTINWAQAFLLPAADSIVNRSLVSDSPNPETLARQGNPRAIASYLSEQLSELGVAVRVWMRSAKEPAKEATSTGGLLPLKRLVVRCEAAYSPDPSLLAEPIAQRLRGLNLPGFQDAVVFGQVQGERQPDWVLRVDLTPPDLLLQGWARWGDVQAIAHLLNQALRPIAVSALLKDATLHLTCRQPTLPDQAQTIATIAPLLTALAPQGIRSVAIYGVAAAEKSTETPRWVHWLDLPATQNATLAKPTLALAQQGDLEAIGFLLSRLLNPNLSVKLATGGIRVQIRRKDDLLHIMTDAPVCPAQSQVAAAIVRGVQPLQVPEIKGVRVYGRRSGQAQPLWSYGADFMPRQRLVPEVTPEFAASDAYVGDLLEPAGALVVRSEVNEARPLWQRLTTGTVQQVQRLLIRSQLFVPQESAALPAVVAQEATPVEASDRLKVALIWGTVGILAVIQSDWLLGRWLQTVERLSQTRVTVAPPAAPEAEASPAPIASPQPSPATLQQSNPKSKQPANQPFNASGFTQRQAANGPTAPDGGLLASPPQPRAQLSSSGTAYPTFNSRQLDDRLVMYRDYLSQHGPPDVLVVGSSRALRGIDPVALQTALAEQGLANVSVFNFGINGATAQVVDLILRQLLPQEALPKLILMADGARAFNSGRDDVTYNGIAASPGYRMFLAGEPPIPGTLTAAAPQSPSRAATETAATTPLTAGYQRLNEAIDQRLGNASLTYSQRDRLKTQLRDAIAQILPAQHSTLSDQSAMTLQDLSEATSPAAAAANSSPSVILESRTAIDQNGFMALPNRFNPATYYQKYARVPGDYDSDYASFQLDGKQQAAMSAIAAFTKERQIPLIFVNLPLTNDYLDATRRRHEAQFQQRMLQQAQQLGFTYRDLSLELADQIDYFSDPSHLNRYGGYEVSRRLAQDVMIPWNAVRRTVGEP